MTSLSLLTPSGLLLKAAPVKLAARRLAKLGFEVELDEAALTKHQRFGGEDDVRLAAIHRVADRAPGIAMATRGGYGLTRLLDGIDWKRVARSVGRGTRWVGHSDFTALQLGLLAHLKGSEHGITWAGPMAADDFGRTDDAGGVDEITRDCFVEAMDGRLEAVGFRTEPGFDGLGVRGTLWGGNLCMLSSMLGTRHFPQVRGGVLFVEDVNEHPYRVERGLLQLAQAGVLGAQKAVVLGAFSEWRKSPNDRGYSLKTAIAHLRSVTRTPILSGLPFGHVQPKVTLPVGAKVELLVQGRDVLIGWSQHQHHGDARKHAHDHEHDEHHDHGPRM